MYLASSDIQPQGPKFDSWVCGDLNNSEKSGKNKTFSRSGESQVFFAFTERPNKKTEKYVKQMLCSMYGDDDDKKDKSMTTIMVIKCWWRQ